MTVLTLFNVLVACVLGVLAASPASAQDATDPASAPSRQDLYREAYAHLDTGNYEEAKRLLLELWSRSRTYDVAASLGQVEFKLGRPAAAANYMAFAIANIAPREKAETLDRYRAGLAELRPMVGTVHVVLEPPNAELILDGQPLDPVPAGDELFVEPGIHRFEARAQTGRGSTKELEIKAGQRHTVDLRPGSTASEADPPAAAPSLVSSKPTPPRPPAQRSLAPVVIGGGIFLAATSAAIVFSVNAGSDKDRAENLRGRIGRTGCADGTASPSDCQAARNAADDYDRNKTLANVSVAVALVSAGATATYLLWPQSTGSASTIRPSVAFASTSAALAVSGRF